MANLAEKTAELAELVRIRRDPGDHVYRWRMAGPLTARGELIDYDGRCILIEIWWDVIAATWRGQAWLNGTSIGHTLFPHDTASWARTEINLEARKYRAPARPDRGSTAQSADQLPLDVAAGGR